MTAIRALDRHILSAGLRRSFGAGSAGGADAGGDEVGDLIEDFTDAIALVRPEAQRRRAKRLSEALGVSSRTRAGPVYVVPSGWLYFVSWGALEIAAPVAVLPMGGWIARTVSAGQAPNPAAGVGEVVAGDDYLGLLRRFYLGGAVATLSSLWPVDDEATRVFMERFHDRARSGEYGQAWLAARDALIEAGFPPGA